MLVNAEKGSGERWERIGKPGPFTCHLSQSHEQRRNASWLPIITATLLWTPRQ
jgi:hypothetical protein